MGGIRRGIVKSPLRLLETVFKFKSISRYLEYAYHNNNNDTYGCKITKEFDLSSVVINKLVFFLSRQYAKLLFKHLQFYLTLQQGLKEKLLQIFFSSKVEGNFRVQDFESLPCMYLFHTVEHLYNKPLSYENLCTTKFLWDRIFPSFIAIFQLKLLEVLATLSNNSSLYLTLQIVVEIIYFALCIICVLF